MLRIFAIAAALLLPVPLSAAASPQEEQVYQVREDDPEMNRARARAIAELDAFLSRLAAPGPGETDFMVKFDISSEGDPEYVWATQLDRSSGLIVGTLINQPNRAQHRFGDRLGIPRDRIIDWAYYRDDVMQGGYTNRVLVGRMSPEEAAPILRDFGWD